MASVVLALALWAVALSNRGPLRTHPLASALVFVAASRLITVALVPAPLQSDFLSYHNLGVEISQHGPMLSSIPTGYPMALGVVYALFGPQVVVAQLLNCAIAVAIATLVFDITQRLWDRRAAVWAIWLFALAPSQILMTSVLGSEAPYCLLLMLSFWLAVRFGWRRLAVAVAIAGLLGASNYVRVTTPAIIPAFALVPFLGAVPFQRAAFWAALLVGGFLVMQAPVIVWNEQTKGELSIPPSDFGGWSLLVGTDPAHGGSYDADLLKVVGVPNTSPDFDKRALQIAIDRLRAHPIQFVALAVRKFPRMWGLENYGEYYTFGTSPGSNQDVGQGLLAVSQVTYLAITALAAVGLWLMRRSPPVVVLAIVVAVASVAAVHTFLEIEPRYHAYFVPLFCVLAGPAGAALRLPRLRGARGAAPV